MKQELTAYHRQKNSLRQAAHDILLHIKDSKKCTAKSLRELKVAAVMDEFTRACFLPECQLLELLPDTWKQQIDEFQPDMLFLESAWYGKDALWKDLVTQCAQVVKDLAEYCRSKRIPVVYWNKEDPPSTDIFIKAAAYADYIFTTDIGCIQRYKTELGNDRVYHLHFGAQPEIHNPIEKYARKDKFCFAGSYYHKYPERCRIFNALADYFIESKGLDIFNRNFGSPNLGWRFPEQYMPCVLGRLEPSQIDLAYKGYIFGINMNTVTGSQTMFARRVFELMASNTLVVGNDSQGVKTYFGDLTFCADDGETLRTALEPYCEDRDLADKLRLLALRKVLEKHLCEDRLDYIVTKVFGRSMKLELPSVCVVSRVHSREEAQRVLKMFRNQRYGRKRLLLVGEVSLPGCEGVTQICEKKWNPGKISEDYIAYFCADDWYGENYLTDLVLTTRYGSFDLIGKAEYFAGSNGTAVRINRGTAYHTGHSVFARRGMLRTALLSGDLPDAETIWSAEKAMSIDAMNYCCQWEQDHCPAAEDLRLRDQGIELEQIEKTADAITAYRPAEGSVLLNARDIVGKGLRHTVSLRVSARRWAATVKSELPADRHQYIHSEIYLNVEDVSQSGTMDAIFRGTGSLKTFGYCIFYNAKREKIGAQGCQLNRITTITIPEGAVYVRPSIRIQGSGAVVIRNVELGKHLCEYIYQSDLVLK